MGTTTETTYRAVIRHIGPNGEDFGRTMLAPRGTFGEADRDRILANGSDIIRPTDEVVIEKTVTVTTTTEVSGQ